MAENHLNLTNTSRLEPEDILDEEFFDDGLDDMDEEEADAYEEYMADLIGTGRSRTCARACSR